MVALAVALVALGAFAFAAFVLWLRFAREGRAQRGEVDELRQHVIETEVSYVGSLKALDDRVRDLETQLAGAQILQLGRTG